MGQLLQNLRSGQTYIQPTPRPVAQPGHIVVQTQASIVSLGTERMLVEFGKAGLLDKARQQPEKVKQVIEKIKTDGLAPTLHAVFSRLDEPLPLGYSNAGIVVDVGVGVTQFSVGDMVASNGAHAEYDHVPVNLAARIPAGVSCESAAFAVIASIALQGIRLADLTLGENVVIFGLGLVGQLAAQLARANGCTVYGIDIDDAKLDLARTLGFTAISSGNDSVENAMRRLTGNAGIDAVVITASAHNDTIVSQAARMCRKRGRIVLVGVVDLNLDRREFYDKELSFQVSCSYGPGRYDSDFEQKGIDYPLPYVRWTEKRNFEAVLECMRSGVLDVNQLITQRVPFEEAPQFYQNISESRNIATLLTYPQTTDNPATIVVSSTSTSGHGASVEKPGIAVVGAGLFSRTTLVPTLRKTGANIRSICSQSGTTAATLAHKFGIEKATSSFESLLADPEIKGIVIATRHNQHADMVASALDAGKHVFVEKPLCLNEHELENIADTYAKAKQKHESVSLTVGFNRRFAPLVQKCRDLLGDSKPIAANFMVNAGALPGNHWLNDPTIGGGRLIGEGCHFIDLFSFFAGPIQNVQCLAMDDLQQTFSMVCKSTNGSIGTINYFSNGSKKVPKETYDIYSEGRSLKLVNFRRLENYGFKGRSMMKTRTQDKGHAGLLEAWYAHVAGERPEPIPMAEIVATTHRTLEALSG